MAEVITKHSVKRKRGDTTAVRDSNVVGRGSAIKVSGKLFHGLREVRKAAKKAKTFETQKLVKKLKASRSKTQEGEEVSELEAQLHILKGIDHEPFANSALLTKLKKDRVLSANEHIQTAIADHFASHLLTPSPAGTPAAKVESRLLSSKVLAAEVHSVVDALKEVVQPSAKKPQPEDNEDADSSDAAPPSKTKRFGAGVPDQDSSDEEDRGNFGEVPDEAGRDSGSARDDGPGNEDGWESGSIDDSRPGRADSGASSSEESSESEEEDEDDDPASHARKGNSVPTTSSREKATRTRAPPNDPMGKSRAATAESTFLPSLSVGFVRGDSDGSDWNDAEADIAGDAPKKNRRGQRARRAIWEQKFGKNANHVKKERESATQDPRHRGKGTDRKKDGGASRAAPHSRKGAASGARSQFTAPPRDSGWAKSGPAAVEKPAHSGAEKQGSDKALHPSWEAKRRLKEKLNPSIVPAQGNKIVF